MTMGLPGASVPSGESVVRMRNQRPGYDEVLKLFIKFYELPKTDLIQLTESKLTSDYIATFFKMVGWRVIEGPTLYSSNNSSRYQADLLLEYQDLALPVEVKRKLDSKRRDVVPVLNRITQKGFNLFDWVVLTDFETIWIVDVEQKKVILESGPMAYINDPDPIHDLLAASIFYVTIAKPSLGSHKRNSVVLHPSPAKATGQMHAQLDDLTLSAKGTVSPGRSQQKGKEAEVIPHKKERLEISSRALSDAYTLDDQLGFDDYAQALVDFITSQKTEKPLTIGIDAAWGMGKTTLMQMVKARLSNDKGQDKGTHTVHTVWFDAWKYDKEESLWAALALDILQQVRKESGIIKRARLWISLNFSRLDWRNLISSIAKSLAFVVVIAILVAFIIEIGLRLWGGTLPDILQRLKTYAKALLVLGAVDIVIVFIKDLLHGITRPFELNVGKYVREPNYKERIGFLAQFEDDFKRVVEVVTAKGKDPLVVFIDDLDRCAPPKAIDVVEAINLLLDSKYCVFVIGMDSRMVAASVESKYKLDFGHFN